MSVRKTSVYLPDPLKRQLSGLAARTRRSEAELLRAAVASLVGAPSPETVAAGDPPVPGRLVGVGVGPGSPDLLTVRAVRALRRATVVAAPCTDLEAPGRAEAIVRQAAPELAVERVVFVMAPEPAQREQALTAVTDRILAWLAAGEEVAFVTLGDPNLYSTFAAVAERVRHRSPLTPVVTVPGIMAFQELAARAGTTLADEHQSFLVLPAHDPAVSAPAGPLSAALADGSRTVVIYKGGRHVGAVAARLEEAGRLDDAVLGELLGLPGERIAALAEAAGRPASYLSTVVAPARTGG